jgi:hypothetical protein
MPERTLKASPTPILSYENQGCQKVLKQSLNKNDIQKHRRSRQEFSGSLTVVFGTSTRGRSGVLEGGKEAKPQTGPFRLLGLAWANPKKLGRIDHLLKRLGINRNSRRISLKPLIPDLKFYFEFSLADGFWF